MQDYVLFADSGSDISKDILDSWGVKCVSLTFKFDDEDTEHLSVDADIKKFYSDMRSGKSGRTSGVNIETYKEAFEEVLKDGKDVLCLTVSSGISTTYNSAWVAKNELSEEYPDRKIVVVDTLAASGGFGLLIKMAVEKKADGATIEEVEKFLTERRNNMCHWFTVDDLTYLKRGGRISATSAIVGSVLNIKPVLHVDNDGKLVSVEKARGRKSALKAIMSKYEQLAEDKGGRIWISHADCKDEVDALEKEFIDAFGVGFEMVVDISPAIGMHAGPGTIALFFMGTEK